MCVSVGLPRTQVRRLVFVVQFGDHVSIILGFVAHQRINQLREHGIFHQRYHSECHLWGDEHVPFIVVVWKPRAMVLIHNQVPMDDLIIHDYMMVMIFLLSHWFIHHLGLSGGNMFHLVRPPGANPSYVPWLPSHLFGVVLNFSLGPWIEVCASWPWQLMNW